ncbi:TIGR00269 family protein [Methanothermobacter thermautotrophicus]
MDLQEFNHRIMGRIRGLIEGHELIKPGEHIAVALSGGKDSVLTLHALSDLRNDLDFELTAITVDEGIGGYRSEGVMVARENAELLGVELIERSFRDEFNFELDGVTDRFSSPCIPCGVFRRWILNRTAREIGASKIATGHNMDDEIQSFIMSLARGDVRKFSKFGPELQRIHPAMVPRIKPLWSTPESEVRLWAVLNDVKVHLDSCPYSHLSMRSRIRDFLNHLESEKQGVKLRVMESLSRTFLPLSETEGLRECLRCGEPSSGDKCKACEFLELIKS